MTYTQLKEVSSDQFTWDYRDGKILGYVSASDLGATAVDGNPFGNTVTVRSTKTGRLVNFSFDKTRIMDGEIAGWKYWAYVDGRKINLVVVND